MVAGCDASIMKDVWEIRAREYDQKKQIEQERKEKSALETINKDWQKRMTSKDKYPKRLSKKPKPVDEDAYFGGSKETSTRHTPQAPRPRMAAASKGGTMSMANQKQNNRLRRLMNLAAGQPSSMVWGKAWKFSKPTPTSQEGTAPPSNWGESWKFMTLQPHIEGTPWPQMNGPKPHQDLTQLYEKHLKGVDSQHLQHDMAVPEWGKSWKYTKSDIKMKSETMDAANQEGGSQYSKTRMLMPMDVSEWNESWKSTKPSEGGSISEDKPANGPRNDAKSGSLESWKFYTRPLHTRSNQAYMSEWAGSWKAAMMVSNNNKKGHAGGHTGEGEQQDHLQKVIMFVSREEKYRDLWSSQLCDEGVPSGWDNSWETIKNLSEPDSEAVTVVEKPVEKPKEIEKPVVVAPIKKVETTECGPKIIPQKYNKLMSPLLIPEMPQEWNEAWKSPKSAHKAESVPDASMVLKQRVKSWSESYKSAKVYHNKPSGPEWRESWHSGYKPCDHSVQQPKQEVFSMSLSHTVEKILHRVKDMETTPLATEWTESWKSLKQHKRMETTRTRSHRSRLFREPVAQESPASEWGDSWRASSLTLNQDGDQWQQGWFNIPLARPDRAMDQYHFMVEEVPRNGPIGARGWNTAWRFSRRDLLTDAEQAGPSNNARLPPRGGRSVGDWEESWMTSNIQSRHNRPSMTEWTESWRSSVFHTDRWEEELPKQNWRDKSLDIIPRREKLKMTSAQSRVSRAFDSQLLKDMQYTMYSESWQAAPLQRHHYKPLSVLDKTKSRCFHLKGSKASCEEWRESWQFVCIPLRQQQQAWDGRCFRFSVGDQSVGDQSDMEPEYHAVNYSNNPEPHPVVVNTSTKWGKSWKISNPMPHIEPGSWLNCHNNPSRYDSFWSRGKNVKHPYAELNNAQSLMLKVWLKGWRFLKLDKKPDKALKKAKESSGGLVIMTKRIKTRKHIYSQIDKEKPSERKYVDSHKLAKTQPRPKGNAFMNMPKMEEEEDTGFAKEWEGSWRFSTQPQKKAAVKVCAKAWADSWKFKIGPYPAPAKAAKSK